MKFTARTTAPSTTDKNWLKVPYGNNHALEINSSTHSVLANCVGYVHGRWLELGEDESKLCRGNANTYFKYTQDGFKRGQKPKLGAIVCWDSAKYGHVGIVERIYSDGTLLISQSNYSGTRFYTKVVNPKTWPVGYTLQGYIYPKNDYTDTATTPVEPDNTRDQIEVKIANLNVRTFASINADRLGYAEKGYYNIYGTAKAGDYTWYNIFPNMWIAYSEDWCELHPAEKVRPLYDINIVGVTNGDKVTIEKLCKDLELTYEIKERLG